MKNKCSINDCARDVSSRGWCRVHYARWQRTGDPTSPTRIYGDDLARFWSKVPKRDEGACWIWTGGKDRDGYGRFRLPSGWQLAHRWIYQQQNGAIPDGLVIDHVRARGCTSRACVNPAHLEVVTVQQNTLRGDASPAINAAKIECVRGHPFTPENTRLRDGRRICRRCERERTG